MLPDASCPMIKLIFASFAALALIGVAFPQARASVPGSAIVVDVSGPAEAASTDPGVLSTIRAELAATNATIQAYHHSKVRLGLMPDIAFVLPRVVLLRNESNRILWGDATGGMDAPLNLVFEGFSISQQNLLQSAFDSAKPFLDTILGQPYVGGTIKVVNKDLTISDRDAVIGGLYLPDDGTGAQAIWFPIYFAPESNVINFIHCLALAYIGPSMFDYDVWGEGFARAATMQTVRLNGVPNGLNATILQQVLENSYDTSGQYSWYNQPALGNPHFIAPNLRETPLPPGGSLGGLYLMRYRMGGSLWAKVLTEYPAFCSTFLSSYYAAFAVDPSISGDVPALHSLAQSTMNTLAGGPNSTIEGRSFALWSRRQYILDTTVTFGRKTFVESIPITSGLAGQDFGVFAVWLSYFDTLAGGNEQLLSGTCYPLFWDSTFARLFLTGQEDRMDIAAGFGSVTPNIPDVFGGPTQWYKATVELPVGDSIARALLPAGAIASAQSPTPNNFYGTVMGFAGQTSGGPPTLTGIVRLTIPGTGQTIDAPLRNGAFGATVASPGFAAPRRTTVQVISVDNGNETVIHTEIVNTWSNRLGLDIRLEDEGVYFAPNGLSAGMQMFGLPILPWVTDHSQTLNLPANQTLLAKWRQDFFRYDLYPVITRFDWGRGFYVRMPSAVPVFTVEGRLPGDQPASVALQVGWNQIVNPFMQAVSLSEVTVQRAAESPRTWNDAIAAGWIDTTIFQFVPGAPDVFSGVPEGGTMTPTTTFAVGNAVFVRSLVAEGVTITFRPGSPQAATATPNPLEPTWRAKLNAALGTIETSSVEFGFATGATSSYDVGIDSLLPPSWGGALQAEIIAPSPMYKDYRARGSTTWNVRLTGLRPGQSYSLTLDSFVSGFVHPVIAVRDIEGGKSWMPRLQATYRFTATSDTRTLRIDVNGGSR